MGFSKQEYWSGLPFPCPGDLPDPGIEPRSPALQADTLTSEPPGKPQSVQSVKLIHGLWRFSLSLRFLKMMLMCPPRVGAGVSGLRFILSRCFALSTLGRDIIHLTQTLGSDLCSESYGGFHGC